MSEPEMHPVVQFLLARMESHPEEFGSDGEGRWQEWIYRMRPLLTPDERIALRGPEMDHIHSQVLDELMNGEDRRRQLEVQQEKEQIALKQAQTLQVQRALAQAQTNAMNHAQSVIGTGTTIPTVTSAISSIQPKPTLDEDALTRIKKYLGL